MGIIATIFAIVFGLLTITGAILLVRQRDPVIAMLCLLAAMTSLGIVLICIGAPIIGLLQLLLTWYISTQVRKTTRILPDPNIRPEPTPNLHPAAIVVTVVLLLILLIDLVKLAVGGFSVLQISSFSFADLGPVVMELSNKGLYTILLLIFLVSAVAISLRHINSDTAKVSTRSGQLGNADSDERGGVG